MNRHGGKVIVLGAALALLGCQDQPAPTEAATRRMLAASVTPADLAGRHLVVFTAERVPADFGERVARLGGSVETSLDSIGVASVTGLSSDAASELAASADTRAVEPDPLTQAQDAEESAGEAADPSALDVNASPDATASPSSAQF